MLIPQRIAINVLKDNIRCATGQNVDRYVLEKYQISADAWYNMNGCSESLV